MIKSNKKDEYSNKNDYICIHKIPSEPTTIILKKFYQSVLSIIFHYFILIDKLKTKLKCTILLN